MRLYRNKMKGAIAGLLAAAALVLIPLSVIGQDPAAERKPPEAAIAVIEEMRGLFGAAGSMAPGMPGNLALEKEIERRFAASGFTNGALRFTAPVFVPGRTSLSISNEAPVRLYAMHPTMYRPGNFAESEFNANLVYMGKGEYSDLARARGTDLNGAIALMDFDCGDKWIRLYWPVGLLLFGLLRQDLQH
jgi:hypothetical protein